MIYYTAQELETFPREVLEPQIITLLCQICLKPVARVSLRELAGLSVSGEPALCFECQPPEDESIGLSNTS